MRPSIRLLIALLAMPLSTQAAAHVITEQQVLQTFLDNNLPLLLGKTQLDAAQAQLIIAKQYPNPDISLSISGVGDTPHWQGGSSYWDKPYENTLSIDQLIETSGKRQLRIDSAQLGQSAQKLLFEDLLRSLKRDLLIAYYDVVKNEQIVHLYNEVLQQLNETSRANFLRLKAGDISETEFNRIEVAVLKAKTDVEQAHLTLTLSRQTLAELLVYHYDPDQLITAETFPVMQSITQPASMLVAQALQQRPDVQAAQLTVDQQQKQVALAEKLATPDIQLTASYKHDPSAEARDGFGVGVGVQIPLWHRYEGEVALARSDEKAKQLSLQQIQQQVKTQVLQAYSQFQQKQRALLRFDQELITRAKQIRSSSLVAYQQGAISLLELLDAENNYRTTMLDYVQAQFEQVQAQLNLNYALGNEGK